MFGLISKKKLMKTLEGEFERYNKNYEESDAVYDNTEGFRGRISVAMDVARCLGKREAIADIYKIVAQKF